MVQNCRVRLKKIKKHMSNRLKFNLDRLKDPSIHESFQATVGGELAVLLMFEDGAEVLTTKCSALMAEIANEISGKHHQKTQP